MDLNRNSVYLITLWYNGFRGMGGIDGKNVCKALKVRIRIPVFLFVK